MKQLVMATLAVILSFAACAQNKVNLPAPRKDADMTLYQALQQRASVRDFKTVAVPDQTLSDLLWAAVGINREDGRLTAPTAMNTQEIRLYVCRTDGAGGQDRDYRQVRDFPLPEHLQRTSSCPFN